MKRRDFHKLLAAAVAGLLVAGCSEPTGEPTPAADKSPSDPSGSPMACSANGCNGKMDMKPGKP